MRPPLRRGGGALRGRSLLWLAALAYVALLPLGQWGSFSVAGAAATLTDVMAATLLLVAAGAAVRWLVVEARTGEGPASAWGALKGSMGRYGGAMGLLGAFGVLAAASALWSSAPGYAAAKGAGYVALAGVALAITRSGAGWDGVLDAWLVGTGLALAVTLLAAVAGPEAWAARVVYEGGSVSGLPVPRLRGPFLHPNGFGDYLVVSAVFLWARWPAWTASDGSGGSRLDGPVATAAAWALAAGIAVALALTVSTAWLAAGVLLLLWGRTLSPRGGGVEMRPLAWLRSIVLRAAGAGLAAVTMAGLVYPLRLELFGVRVGSSGIRPEIWSDAAGALTASPLIGVGGVPYLASVPDPQNPVASAQLWDAHNAYLSVGGQYGLIGVALAAAGLWLLVRAVRSPGGPDGAPDLAVVGGAEHETGLPAPVLRDRARRAVLAAMLAMAVHGVAIAGEDLRHWWAVLGVAGVVVWSGRES